MTAEATAALEEARQHFPGNGTGHRYPPQEDPTACVRRWLVRDWWNRVVARAGLEPKRGRGWHSLRSKFTSDLMSPPLKVLCELVGWKTARTVLQCEQEAAPPTPPTPPPAHPPTESTSPPAPSPSGRASKTQMSSPSPG